MKDCVPKVSIYMTVKNGVPLISETLKSIFEQDYSNWELIIIDDGSDIPLKVFLKPYLIADERIKLYSTNGIGRAKALNMALSNCNNQFVCNIDADDIWHKSKLSKQIKLMANNDIDLLATGFFVFSDLGECASHIEIECNKGVLSPVRNIEYINNINHSSVMIDAKSIDINALYNEGLKSNIDYDLWLRLSSLGHQLFVFDEKLTGKRFHLGQSFENKKRFNYLKQSFLLKFNYITINHEGKKKYKFLSLALLAFFYGLIPQIFRGKMSGFKTAFLSKK